MNIIIFELILTDNPAQFNDLAFVFYRHLKNSCGFNGIRTQDLCDAGAVQVYQLSNEATQLGVGQLVGRRLVCSHERTR